MTAWPFSSRARTLCSKDICCTSSCIQIDKQNLNLVMRIYTCVYTLTRIKQKMASLCGDDWWSF